MGGGSQSRGEPFHDLAVSNGGPVFADGIRVDYPDETHLSSSENNVNTNHYNLIGSTARRPTASRST